MENQEDKSETSTERCVIIIAEPRVLRLFIWTKLTLLLPIIQDFDAGRGGWGHLKSHQEMEASRQREQDEIYRGDHDGGRGREVPSGMRNEDDDDDVSCLWQNDT